MVQHLSDQARHWLTISSGMEVGGLDRLRKFLRTGTGNYGSAMAVLPLGDRCGVPEHAGTVDTSAVLAEHFPSLSAKAEHTHEMLGVDPSFHTMSPRITSLLDSSYPAYVECGLRAGLFSLNSPQEVPQVQGLSISSGGFAVPKDTIEDRPITPLEGLNS